MQLALKEKKEKLKRWQKRSANNCAANVIANRAAKTNATTKITGLTYVTITVFIYRLPRAGTAATENFSRFSQVKNAFGKLLMTVGCSASEDLSAGFK